MYSWTLATSTKYCYVYCQKNVYISKLQNVWDNIRDKRDRCRSTHTFTGLSCFVLTATGPCGFIIHLLVDKSSTFTSQQHLPLSGVGERAARWWRLTVGSMYIKSCRESTHGRTIWSCLRLFIASFSEQHLQNYKMIICRKINV